MPRIFVAFAAVCALAAALPSQLTATSLLVRNLEDLTRHSQRIFAGECLSRLQGVDSQGLPYTLYEFRVHDSVLGVEKGQVLAIKQFGLLEPQKVPQLGLVRLTHIEGMPHYLPGKRYLLFLRSESAQGFCSPIGLLQGAFAISGQGGSRTVLNALGNRNLAADTNRPSLRLSPGGQLEGPVSYSAVLTLVDRTLAGERLAPATIRRALKAARSSR